MTSIERIIANFQQTAYAYIGQSIATCEQSYGEIMNLAHQHADTITSLKKKRDQQIKVIRANTIPKTEAYAVGSNQLATKERALQQSPFPLPSVPKLEAERAVLLDQLKLDESQKKIQLSKTAASIEEKQATLLLIENEAWTERERIIEYYKQLIGSIHTGAYVLQQKAAIKKEIAEIKAGLQQEIAKHQRGHEQMVEKIYSQFQAKVAELKERYFKKHSRLLKAFEEAFDKLKTAAAPTHEWLNEALAMGQLQKDWITDFQLYDQFKEEGLASIRQQLFQPAPNQLTIGQFIYQKTVDRIHFEVALPHIVPFYTQTNFIFRFNNQTQAQAYQFLPLLLHRSLGAVAPGSLNLNLVDLKDTGIKFGPFRHLNKQILNLINTSRDLQDLLDELLNSHIKNNGLKIDEDATPHIGTYNEENPDSQVAYNLLFFLNYPYGTERYHQQIKSILDLGPIRGVNTILFYNEDLQNPEERLFKTADVLSCEQAVVFDFINDELGPLKLSEIALPQSFDSNGLIEMVNRLSDAAQFQKIPFAKHLPPQDQWMTAKAYTAAKAPIGIGRNAQLQQIAFHTKQMKTSGIVIGAPGSGKSNLLHIIITSLAVHYPPEELQFYLIDLNSGGEELKRYADTKLPHAKVISIGSNAEFAYNVLLELHRELERRGELFQSAGAEVNDISKYVENNPDKKLPRLILIIDEFQEMFREFSNTSYADEIQDLLADFVRRGRKYGINFIMASQSIKGSRLSSSIVDLAHIRIALKSDADDAAQIMSGNNTEAITIKYQGEGIYNDEQGSKEANSRFQTFFIEPEDHIILLQELRAEAERRQLVAPSAKPLVFRGAEMAYFKNNTDFKSHTPHEGGKTATIWLGESYTIYERYFSFNLKSDIGQNILIGGGLKDSPLKVAMAIFASLLRNYKAGEIGLRLMPEFIPNTEEEQHFQSLVAAAKPYFDCQPIAKDGRIEELLLLKKEKDLRHQNQAVAHQKIFVFITNIERNTTFTVKETFNISEGLELLIEILKDGPQVGIHTIISCSTYNDFKLRLKYDQLESFRHRIGLQMDAESSNNFLDDSRRGTRLSSKTRLNSENTGIYFNNIEKHYSKVNVYQYIDEEELFQSQELPREVKSIYQIEEIEVEEEVEVEEVVEDIGDISQALEALKQLEEEEGLEEKGDNDFDEMTKRMQEWDKNNDDNLTT